MFFQCFKCKLSLQRQGDRFMLFLDSRFRGNDNERGSDEQIGSKNKGV